MLPSKQTQAEQLPEPGTFIGKYELIRELGRGGMGAVYLARDTKLGRRVAIKFLLAQNPDLTRRFILEARATAQFQHENIIVIYEVDEYDGNPFMVLEYLQGSPLQKLLDNGRKLSPRRSIDIMIAVTRALERAHASGIVHRDLKPDNIFLTDAGTVKVLDFGIAKLMLEQAPQAAERPGHGTGTMANVLSFMASAHDATQPGQSAAHRGGPTARPTAQLTQQGAIIGTLPYMSPEQWGIDTVDHRSDIWAAGILFFRMIAGQHPLGNPKGSQWVVTAMIDQPMPLARAVCPDIPEDIASIIDRCLIKPKQQRLGSASELLSALEDLTGERSRTFRADVAPYAGLSSFQESDSARFFGRSSEIAAVVTRLHSQPIIGIVGPSGVGKSSFVRAGVVPALKQSGESWSSLVIRPGRQPVSALAQAISPMTASTTTTTVSADLDEIRATQERLYREPGYMGVVLRSRARRKQQNMLVFIDQFEELYTLVADPAERLAFTRCLASVADDPTTPLRVVISIRSDFLDRVSEDPHFIAELTRGLFFLTPPGRAGLRDALIQPAEMAGFTFETETMVDHMLDHLEHTPGALPLLQFAATKLWDMRDAERRLLTAASYQQIGGIAGALASHADSVLAELPPSTQVLARAVFLRLVTPDRTRAIVSVDEIRALGNNPHDVQRLLDQLVNARLVVLQTGDGSGAASAEIVHESLIHSWPLLRRWLDENQDDAVFLEQLRSAARQWQAKGHAQGLLWRGEAMEEARLWHRRYRGELPELEQRYLDAVFALSARSSRRKRVALLAAVTFLSLLVVAAGVALVVIRDTEQEATAQAAAATRAEKQVREQVAKVERANAVANQERERAVGAQREAESAARELAGKNTELLDAIEAADSARRAADNARTRAESSRRRAKRNARAARKAESLAKDNARAAHAAERLAAEANDALQAKLAEERKRLAELEKQGVISLVPDMEVAQ